MEWKQPLFLNSIKHKKPFHFTEWSSHKLINKIWSFHFPLPECEHDVYPKGLRFFLQFCTTIHNTCSFVSTLEPFHHEQNMDIRKYIEVENKTETGKEEICYLYSPMYATLLEPFKTNFLVLTFSRFLS